MSLGRVLVVDDEANVRKSVRLILAKEGYEVIEAEDGAKAIAAVTSGNNPRMPDLIICDLYMPKVNGLEAIPLFCSQFPSIPVIVLTGQPEVHNVVSMFKQGVVEYLIKPVTPAGLMAAVTNAMTYRKQPKQNGELGSDSK